MTTPKKILFIFETGPYSNAKGAEALDALMVAASFDQSISVLFIYDGVFQIKSQQAEVADIKQYTRAFKALNDFDVTAVFAHDQSLFARGLGLQDLMIDCSSVTSTKIAELITTHDRVFTF